ncbi:MAG: acyl-CoA thioester hydrolase/BAAT C-terminal domain-containing protein, partial [Planctomycetota bacterium]
EIGEKFPGSFLLRDTSRETLPVVIALGGSEGGDSAARSIAPKLAARGFACIGLPYYSPAWGNQRQQFPGLPRAFAEIPLETLEDIVAWIETQEDLDSDRIALYGVSKGAEMALAAASRIDRFVAIAAIVPSDVIWEGWGVAKTTSSFSWRGKPLPFVPYLGMGNEFAKSGRGQAVRIRLPHDAGRLANPERVEAASIQVESIQCPVFVVGGDEDNTWDSGGMARNISERRLAAKLETEVIVSQEAGHQLSGTAYTNLSPANAEVRSKAFPALIKFLSRNLDLARD